MQLESITLYRCWVALLGTLKTDAERGKLYQAIAEYALDATAPELPQALQSFFDLMRPEIDKSRARRAAQFMSVQKRLQNRLQNDLQNQSQTDLQNNLQNSQRKEAKETDNRKKKKDTTYPKRKNGFSFAELVPPNLATATFEKKWSEWESYRRAKGKPVSRAAAVLQFKMLAAYDEATACQIIDESIKNDYQGLFAPKTDGQRLPIQRDYTGI